MGAKAKTQADRTGASALVHTPVLEEGFPAIYVAHRSLHEWVVGGPGFTEADAGRFQRVDMAVALETDPSIAETLNLPSGSCAFRKEPGAQWRRRRVPVGRTFLLSYEARPTEAVSRGGALGGAFVNCWVVSKSLDAAKRKSRRHVEASGWVVVDEGPENEVDDDNVTDAVRRYYRQVQVDGLVCVFHAFPPEAVDA